MDPGTSNAFLSGQGIPVDPAHVEETLANLWGTAAEAEGGTTSSGPAVTRVVLSNLVVADLGPGPSRIESVLETLTRQYPARLILLKSAPPGSSGVQAEVSALCHMPAPGRPQVCSELIVLRAAPADIHLLPATIRGLLEPELPLVLLWSGDPMPARDLYCELARESSRVILDLPGPLAEADAVQFALNLERNPFDRDIAWFGITPWRELVAQFFDASGCQSALQSISTVTIEAHSPTPDRLSRVGLWMMGWLAGQLGWRQVARARPTPHTLEARFQAPDGPVNVRLSLEADASLALPALVRVVIETRDGGRYAVERILGTSNVRVTAQACGHDPLPRTLRAPEWDSPRRLSAALESARDDPPYRAALPHVLWALAGNGASIEAQSSSSGT